MAVPHIFKTHSLSLDYLVNNFVIKRNAETNIFVCNVFQYFRYFFDKVKLPGSAGVNIRMHIAVFLPVSDILIFKFL